jgi:DNA invertase Pin-like site-specific DNA recombinase
MLCVTDTDRLLDRLRRTADQARHHTAERNQLIVELRAQGVPLRTIAEAAGLTHPAIIRILEREQ